MTPHPRYRTPCTYVYPVDGVARRCGRPLTRRFVNGWYCESCAARWEAVVASWAGSRLTAPQDTAK